MEFRIRYLPECPAIAVHSLVGVPQGDMRIRLDLPRAGSLFGEAGGLPTCGQRGDHLPLAEQHQRAREVATTVRRETGDVCARRDFGRLEPSADPQRLDTRVVGGWIVRAFVEIGVEDVQRLTRALHAIAEQARGVDHQDAIVRVEREAAAIQIGRRPHVSADRR